MMLRSIVLQQLCFIFKNNLATVSSLIPLCVNSVNTGHNLDQVKYITYLTLIGKDSRISHLYKISLLTKFTSHLTVCDIFYINVSGLLWTDRT